MTAPTITDVKRIEAIRALGYNEPEARFLCLVALHSGYFLRRQYIGFVGCARGDRPQRFIQKLMRRGHAVCEVRRQNRQVYRLHFKAIYSAIGETDNRNRRRRQPAAIKNKLMCLDFVLANREQRYLATENEKLDFFCRISGVAFESLPARTYLAADGRTRTKRYFVDKFPTFLSKGTTPEVTFTYIDEGCLTPSAFETHLHQYERLFASLNRFEMVYVATGPGVIPSATRAFDRFIRGMSDCSNGQADIGRLLRYFRDRSLYESGETAEFDRRRLIQLRTDRDALSPAFDSLFDQWKVRGDAAVAAGLGASTAKSPRMNGVLSTHILEHDYELFGTL